MTLPAKQVRATGAAMGINVTSRIRKAMVTLSLLLSLIFTVLIFMLVYVIEDQVFVNQVKLAQKEYTRVVSLGDSNKIKGWQPSTTMMKRIDSLELLPENFPTKLKAQIIQQAGVHEYFDDNNAMFISRLDNFTEKDNQAGFIVYDVSDLLAVRGTKISLFMLIGTVSLLITLAALVMANRLTKSTLAPVVKLSSALKKDDLDEVIIEMANEFSEDEISVLTRELANSLEAVQSAAQREFEFNRGVSHELRSPIQVAQSAVELLHLVSKGDDASAKPIARLQRSIHEMNQVAESFLWLASSKTLDQKDCISVGEFEELITDLADTLPIKTLEFHAESADDCRLPIPRSVITTVMRSLLRNSSVHGDGDKVVVKLGQDRIEVSNAMDKNTNPTSGFGVGLPIVSRLLERFKCRLESKVKRAQFYVLILFPNS